MSSGDTIGTIGVAVGAVVLAPAAVIARNARQQYRRTLKTLLLELDKTGTPEFEDEFTRF